MGNKYNPYGVEERRSRPRTETNFFRVMLALNVIGWLALVVTLVLFHFARPDFISGVQEYWGIEGDTGWSAEYVKAMQIMLQVCLLVSLVSIVMRARRSRRQGDQFGFNLFVLASIAVISLITLATTMGVTT
ncbi:hypothetical protein [Alteromonas stellipolaris]|uniref:hypothetical protein n=1 Tax=Alteromonas stellipolaris TaxID=233316 RepID=UPI0024940A8A|nr:hypothetical protein [Alteromonas stellipolaris]MDO6536742.1 hypothetical protein [Alteromonas stellipolaris]MDO6625630.1 hypothetical protein [Alteromonas stellipolaris]